MNAHETPSGTRMMCVASVNAIWARAQGTGSTPTTGSTALSQHVDGSGGDKSEDRERGDRLHAHGQFGPVGRGHRVGGAERDRVREPEVQVVEEHRTPTRRRGGRARCL